MLIYQLVFGTDSGQVNCVFHDDTRASSGIGPNGEFNCFTCGAKAHNEIGFICKYFGVGFERAKKIMYSLKNLQKYKHAPGPLDQEQLDYLKSVGISSEVANEHFIKSAVGKLIMRHTWVGVTVGYTWFNPPELSTYNASAPKYKYDGNNISGLLVPMDTVHKYDTIIVTEGEKDMLTAKTMGIPNVVAKLGGAKSYILGGVPMQNKRVILCYDCDEWGVEGAIKDATALKERFGCNVKVVDLGLQDKEDLNDYFLKYGKTKGDFYNLIKSTPEFVVPEKEAVDVKILKYLDSLTQEERKALENIIKNKGEETNETS